MGEWERINDALKEKALRHMPEVGVKETAVPGLSISRRLAHDILENSLYKPCIGVMLQGRKKSIIGMEDAEGLSGEGGTSAASLVSRKLSTARERQRKGASSVPSIT